MSTTCGDFGGVKDDGEPCGKPVNDGRCRFHEDQSQSGHSRARAKYKPERVARLIMREDGNMTRVAEMLGCSRTTLYRYLNEYEEVAQARDDAREGFVDLAEKKLRDAVKEGDTGAIRFVLRCWGKKRGWTEKQEIDVTSGGQPINRKALMGEIKDMTAEEKAAAFRELTDASS